MILTDRHQNYVITWNCEMRLFVLETGHMKLSACNITIFSCNSTISSKKTLKPSHNLTIESKDMLKWDAESRKFIATGNWFMSCFLWLISPFKSLEPIILSVTHHNFTLTIPDALLNCVYVFFYRDISQPAIKFPFFFVNLKPKLLYRLHLIKWIFNFGVYVSFEQ